MFCRHSSTKSALAYLADSDVHNHAAQSFFGRRSAIAGHLRPGLTVMLSTQARKQHHDVQLLDETLGFSATQGLSGLSACTLIKAPRTLSIRRASEDHIGESLWESPALRHASPCRAHRAVHTDHQTDCLDTVPPAPWLSRTSAVMLSSALPMLRSSSARLNWERARVPDPSRSWAWK